MRTFFGKLRDFTLMLLMMVMLATTVNAGFWILVVAVRESGHIFQLGTWPAMWRLYGGDYGITALAMWVFSGFLVVTKQVQLDSLSRLWLFQ